MNITSINFSSVVRIVFYGQSFASETNTALATVDIVEHNTEETMLLAYNDSGQPGAETYMADRFTTFDEEDKQYNVLKILKPSVAKSIAFLASDGKQVGVIDFTANSTDPTQYSDSIIMISYGEFDMATDPTIFLHEKSGNAHYIDIKMVPFEVSKGTGLHPNFVRGVVSPVNAQAVGQNLIHRNFKITYLGNMINDRFNATS